MMQPQMNTDEHRWIQIIFILCVLCVFVVSYGFAVDDKTLEELDKELKPAPVEEESNPIEALNRISDKMAEAEDALSKAAVTPPKTVNAGTRMTEAVEELKRLLNKTAAQQKEVIDDIERLIKSAREMQMKESSGSGQQPQPKEDKPKMEETEPKPKDNEPAPKAYDEKSNLPPHLRDRTGPTAKWGNLPPKLRDELIQSEQEEFLPEYSERLREYFKRLAEEK